MTTKHLRGTYSSGYGVQSPTTTVRVAAGGYVEGKGVYTPASDTGAYTIINAGRIVGAQVSGYHGVYLGHGGSVTNGSVANTAALLEGYGGVAIMGAAGAVTNFGTLLGTGGATTAGDGVLLGAGGSLVNGSKGDTTALIGGYFGVQALGAATVANFGTLTGGQTSYRGAVALFAGGTVKNGSATDTTALIEGGRFGVFNYGYDVDVAVVNFGTIHGGAYGVDLSGFGSVTNGSTSDTSALISGYVAVETANTVINYGTLLGHSPNGTAAVIFAYGSCSLTNGSADDTKALISGYSGVLSFSYAPITVTNLGTIVGFGSGAFYSQGVFSTSGATVTNGSAGDTAALISGYVGVQASGAATVTNFGTLQGAGNGSGVKLLAGGAVTNGSAGDSAALIEGGQFGVYNSGQGEAATVVNFGTISGASAGVALNGYGSVTNGSTSDTSALISGIDAVESADAVTNYGTLLGNSTSGSGVVLSDSGSVTNGSALDSTALISGSIGVEGLGAAPSTVTNFGTILGLGTSAAGVYLASGGSVTNGSASDTTALIEGGKFGVYNRSQGAAAVVNFGTIRGAASGVDLGGSGSVTNGSTSDTSAVISGYVAVESAGAVTNYGTLQGDSAHGEGVALFDSGSVINGSALDTTALISGSSGVLSFGAALGTVINFGTIHGVVSGVNLKGHGSVTNGSAGDTSALISGFTAVETASTVTNYGTLLGNSTYGEGVALFDGGSVTNGSAIDTKALISGSSGIESLGGGPNTVTNFGTIVGLGTSFPAAGVDLASGGSVTNGSTGDAAALISGYYGVEAFGAATVANFGTLQGLGNGAGVALLAGGLVTNGSAGDTTALIEGGQFGVYGRGFTGAANVVNFGTIQGSGQGAGGGVDLSGYGSVTNGSADDTLALISGFNAVSASTVTNYGTLLGDSTHGSGVAVSDSGSVTNGSALDTTALISGYNAVEGNGAGPSTVVNFGAIQGVRTGVDLSSGGSVTNFGILQGGSAGVELNTGGSVANGSADDTNALISGYFGVQARGATPATVANFGTVQGAFEGVDLLAGGSVTNGSTLDATALISGYEGVHGSGAGPSTVVNFGAIQGGFVGVYLLSGGSVTNFGTVAGLFAVLLTGGGTVINGSAGDTTALINGNEDAVFTRNVAATVANFGTLQGQDLGVSLSEGGLVTNGSAVDTTALISGGYAAVGALNGSVSNFGTLQGQVFGVVLAAGVVTNGSARDTTALISGYFAFEAGRGAGTIANFGTLQGRGNGSGVALFVGGAVKNGSATDTTALIEGGQFGIYNRGYGAAATVVNFGTIHGAGFGVCLNGYGSLTNGSTSDTSALISGVDAVVSAETVNNFGTIAGGSLGVSMYNSGGSITNGSSTDRSATISGGLYGAVDLTYNAAVTVTNFGTIAGTDGLAVQFFSSSDTLVVEAGSTFVGSVLGAGGTLDLGSGSGVIKTAQADGGMNEKVSGSMAPTLFTNFATVEASAGTSFKVTGDGVIGAAQSLVAAGGTLIFSAAITGMGSIVAGAGGTLTVDGAAASTLAMAFTGTGAALDLASPSAFAATITGFAAGDRIDLLAIMATSATLGAGDTLTIMNGNHLVATLQLAGTYTGDIFSVVSDDHGGTDITVNAPGVWSTAATPAAAAVPAPPLASHAFVQAMAGYGGSTAHAAAFPGEAAWQGHIATLLASGRHGT